MLNLYNLLFSHQIYSFAFLDGFNIGETEFSNWSSSFIKLSRYLFETSLRWELFIRYSLMPKQVLNIESKLINNINKPSPNLDLK